jgi:hypothetical protein
MPDQDNQPQGPRKEAMLFHDLVCDYERYQDRDQPQVAHESLRTLIGAIRRHLGGGSNSPIGGITYGPTLQVVGEYVAPTQAAITLAGSDLWAASQRSSEAFNGLRELSKAEPYAGPSLEKIVEAATSLKTPELGVGDLVFEYAGFKGNTFIIQAINEDKVTIRSCRSIAQGKGEPNERVVDKTDLGFLRKAGDFPPITVSERPKRLSVDTSRAEMG